MNKDNNLTHVVIYIDGACSGNPGPGGWGAILIAGENRKELSGSETMTTNNRMELTAAIRALEALKRTVRADIYTDSTYVMKGMTEWLPQWRWRNWRLKSGGEVENRDLWEQLAALAGTHEVTWHWIKGHGKDELNKAADRLATSAIGKNGLTNGK